MPKYIVFRTVGEVSEEQMEARMRSSIEAADQMPGVRWIRSYYSAEEGKIYCEYEAPRACYELGGKTALECGLLG